VCVCVCVCACACVFSQLEVGSDMLVTRIVNSCPNQVGIVTSQFFF